MRNTASQASQVSNQGLVSASPSPPGQPPGAGRSRGWPDLSAWPSGSLQGRAHGRDPAAWRRRGAVLSPPCSWRPRPRGQQHPLPGSTCSSVLGPPLSHSAGLLLQTPRLSSPRLCPCRGCFLRLQPHHPALTSPVLRSRFICFL